MMSGNMDMQFFERFNRRLDGALTSSAKEMVFHWHSMIVTLKSKFQSNVHEWTANREHE